MKQKLRHKKIKRKPNKTFYRTPMSWGKSAILFTIAIVPLLVLVPFFSLGGDTTKQYVGYKECSITKLTNCFFNIQQFFGLGKSEQDEVQKNKNTNERQGQDIAPKTPPRNNQPPKAPPGCHYESAQCGCAAAGCCPDVLVCPNKQPLPNQANQPVIPNNYPPQNNPF